jgi:hypothetical protein
LAKVTVAVLALIFERADGGNRPAAELVLKFAALQLGLGENAVNTGDLGADDSGE